MSNKTQTLVLLLDFKLFHALGGSARAAEHENTGDADCKQHTAGCAHPLIQRLDKKGNDQQDHAENCDAQKDIPLSLVRFHVDSSSSS